MQKKKVWCMAKDRLLIYFVLILLLLSALAVHSPQMLILLKENVLLNRIFTILPFLPLVLVVLLGIRYNQLGLVWGGISILAAFWGWQRTDIDITNWQVQWLMILLTTNLLWALLQMPRKLFSLSAVWSLLFAGVQVGVTCGLHWVEIKNIAYISNFISLLKTFSWWNGGHLANAVLAFQVVALLGLLAVYFLKRSSEALGFFSAGLAVALAFAVEPLAVSVPVFLAAAGLILFFMRLEIAYQMAYLDELTGLPGRRSLNRTLANLSRKYAIAMIDIDHFKKFNDSYGHDAGDEVLQMVAAEMRLIRGGGRAYRYGGEEFTVIFNRRSASEARPYMEEFRERLAKRPFVVRNKAKRKQKTAKNRKKASSKNVQVTVSIGVADSIDKRVSAEEVIKQADNKLYQAKKNGRNQVVV